MGDINRKRKTAHNSRDQNYRIAETLEHETITSLICRSSDYNEQHLIIAHRLAELEKRRVGTRYLAKDQTAPADGGAKNSIKDSMAKCTIS